MRLTSACASRKHTRWQDSACPPSSVWKRGSAHQQTFNGEGPSHQADWTDSAGRREKSLRGARG